METDILKRQAPLLHLFYTA